MIKTIIDIIFEKISIISDASAVLVNIVLASATIYFIKIQIDINKKLISQQDSNIVFNYIKNNHDRDYDNAPIEIDSSTSYITKLKDEDYYISCSSIKFKENVAIKDMVELYELNIFFDKSVKVYKYTFPINEFKIPTQLSKSDFGEQPCYVSGIIYRLAKSNLFSLSLINTYSLPIDHPSRELSIKNKEDLYEKFQNSTFLSMDNIYRQMDSYLYDMSISSEELLSRHKIDNIEKRIREIVEGSMEIKLR